MRVFRFGVMEPNGLSSKRKHKFCTTYDTSVFKNATLHVLIVNYINLVK